MLPRQEDEGGEPASRKWSERKGSGLGYDQNPTVTPLDRGRGRGSGDQGYACLARRAPHLGGYRYHFDFLLTSDSDCSLLSLIPAPILSLVEAQHHRRPCYGQPCRASVEVPHTPVHRVEADSPFVDMAWYRVHQSLRRLCRLQSSHQLQ